MAEHAHTTSAPIVRRSPPPAIGVVDRRSALDTLTGGAVTLTAAFAGYLIAGGAL